jgi:glycosyltransferase involved in cell wall biosynthesis
LRVAHVHRIRGIGGSERHLLTLLPALRGRGIEPVFVGLDDPGWDADPFYGELDGVETVRLPAPRDVDPALARRLRRALRGLRPDVVHTHLVHADVYGALATPAPLVSTKHNDDPFRAGPFRFVERGLMRRADRIVAITEALKRFNVERVGLPADKIDVVPYGLDEPPAAWGENPPLELTDGPLVACICRLVPQKGVDVAVRALAGLDTTLIVLGEGSERPRLEALASELGVRLVLPGRVPDVAAVLRRASALVHPVRWEGFGLALLEAMLCGLPVVASRVSSVPEIVVDGETGCLVPPDDPDSLRKALRRVLEEPGDFGAKGLERARTEFSVDRMATRTLAVYDKLPA